MMLSRRTFIDLFFDVELTTSRSLLRSFLYHTYCTSLNKRRKGNIGKSKQIKRIEIEENTFCISDMPTNKRISFLGSKDFSTSDLSLRRRKGRRTLCSFCTTSTLPSEPSNLNQLSKSSDDANTSGSRKFRRAHSSCRLFCDKLVSGDREARSS